MSITHRGHAYRAGRPFLRQVGILLCRVGPVHGLHSALQPWLHLAYLEAGL